MATITMTKEKAIVEDLDLGMGNSTGSRAGKQINATLIPYDTTKSIAEELDSKSSLIGGDTRYAYKQGENVTFTVADAVQGTEATPLNQVNSILTAYPLTTQVTSALATKADKNGNVNEVFNVYSVAFNVGGPFPANTETVNFGYMTDWFNGAIAPAIDDKAEKSEVISKTDIPSTPYVPSHEQHPANKKYVDDKVLDIGAGDMTKAEFVNAGSATTAVHTTNNVGSFGNVNGMADANKGILKLSNVTMLDANAITDYGIGIFIGVDIQNGPPATTGVPVAIEQMDMDGTGRLIGQRCTTDIGVFTRFGFNTTTYGSQLGGGTQAFQFSLWSHTLTETDYSTTYAGGTVKMTVSGTDCAITNDGSDAIIP